jgi:beta-lactamase superfamily II metal-dependent hydrolase
MMEVKLLNASSTRRVNTLQVTVFDVGQASSILVDFGRGCLGVIDCGVNISGKNPLSEELIRRLESDSTSYISFILFTHLDWDHISGFEGLIHPVIKKRIRRLYCNGLEFRSLWEVVGKFVRRNKRARFDRNPPVARNIKSLGHINKLLDNPPHPDFHGELVAPESSDPTVYPVQIKLADLDGKFFIRLFAPSQSLRNKAASGLRKCLDGEPTYSGLMESIGRTRPDWNAASAIISIEYKGVRVLFGGDANHLTWSEVLSRDDHQLLRSDVVVAWHHGARLGFHGGEDYDEKVWRSVFGKTEVGSDRSACTLVSHGCSHYGHPHNKTIESISRCGANVICTQLRDGLVKDANERREAISAARQDIHLGMAGEWDVYRIASNACSGNITAQIRDDGEISINCEGPRQPGDAPESRCCLSMMDLEAGDFHAKTI